MQKVQINLPSQQCLVLQCRLEWLLYTKVRPLLTLQTHVYPRLTLFMSCNDLFTLECCHTLAWNDLCMRTAWNDLCMRTGPFVAQHWISCLGSTQILHCTVKWFCFVGRLYTNLRPNLPSIKIIFVLQLFVQNKINSFGTNIMAKNKAIKKLNAHKIWIISCCITNLIHPRSWDELVYMYVLYKVLFIQTRCFH